jgi:hypothetical protein
MSTQDNTFVGLTKVTGGEIWIRRSAILAVEKTPGEDSARIRMTDGTICDVEGQPDDVADIIERVTRDKS